MLLVGSYSVKDVIKRDKHDIDLNCTEEEYNNLLKFFDGRVESVGGWLSANKRVINTNSGTILEIEIASEGSTSLELMNLVEKHSISNIDIAYSLKMSHRYLRNSPHFYKTMRDIHLLREAGAKIPEELKEWFVRREKETYSYQHPKLNRSKNDFFDTTIGVEYKYDHDSIHQAIKFYDKPAYQYFMVDNADVLCSKEKFDDCPVHIKNAAVLEESIVLALERSLIPFDWAIPSTKAFIKALEKVCTSITSGWFREYAWENHDTLLHTFIKINESIYQDYIKEKFEEGLNLGIIKDFNKELYRY